MLLLIVVQFEILLKHGDVPTHFSHGSLALVVALLSFDFIRDDGFKGTEYGHWYLNSWIYLDGRLHIYL